MLNKILAEKIRPDKQNILITSFIVDGVGDWVHVMQIATAIKHQYPNFKLLLAITSSKENASVIKLIKKDLDSTNIFFEVYLQFKDIIIHQEAAKWENGEIIKKFIPNKKELNLNAEEIDNINYLEKNYCDLNTKKFSEQFADEKFKNSLCLCIQIATTLKIDNKYYNANNDYNNIPSMHQWLYDNNRVIVLIAQHGHGTVYLKYEPKIIERNMGLSKNAYGIRLCENWLKPLSIEEKIAAVTGIENALFKDKLLNDVQGVVQNYIKKYSIIPLYAQSAAHMELFLLYNIEYFSIKFFNSSSERHVIDFYVPLKYLSPNTIDYLQNKIFCEKKVAFIFPDKILGAKQPNFRVFSGFVLNDKDYKNLYRLGRLGALASGDDTLCTVLSSHNLPMLSCKSMSKADIDCMQRKYINFPRLPEQRSIQELINLIYELKFKHLGDYFSIMLGSEEFFNSELTSQTRSDMLKLINKLVVFRKINENAIYNEFYQFRKKLFVDYNFFDKLPKIMEEGLTNSIKLRPYLNANNLQRYYFSNTAQNIDLLKQIYSSCIIETTANKKYITATIPSYLLNSKENNGYREQLGMIRYFLDNIKMEKLKAKLASIAECSIEPGESNLGKKGWLLSFPLCLDNEIRPLLGMKLNESLILANKEKAALILQTYIRSVKAKNTFSVYLEDLNELKNQTLFKFK